MMRDPFFVLIVVAVLAVLVVLMLGLGNFARGGDKSGQRSNRLMQYRIIAQAIAVALIAIYVFVKLGAE